MAALTLHSGLRSLQQRQYHAIHSACIDAIKADISNPVPYFLLGVIAADHGNRAKALELFSKAETLDKSNPYFPAYLGKTLSDMQQPVEAKASADRAAKCKIIDGFLADIIGVIFSRCGAHELAIPMFERAVKLDNAQANFYYNLGASAQFIGDFENAETAYKNAIRLDPAHYRAWASRISLKKQTPEENFLEPLKALFSKLSNDEDGSHQIGHAIAKTYEDLGQYEASFDWLIKAKASKRERYRYDRKAGEKTFAAARYTSRISSHPPAPGDAPIFVTGLPRTGTTLVDRILSSHSKVTSAGELNIFSQLIKTTANTTSKHVLDAETFEAAQNIDLPQIGRDYIKSVRDRIGPTNCFVDKMPLNFFYAALIHKALPEARIIVLRRSAMDSCLSNFRQLLSVQESFYNYTFDLEDTAFFYRQFAGLIDHWRETVPQSRFFEIRYEDIVFDQETQTRRLLDFCGLEFEEACLRFHENTAPVSTASSVQVRQPLYSGSIGRWKKYGTRLDELKAALGALADD